MLSDDDPLLVYLRRLHKELTAMTVLQLKLSTLKLEVRSDRALKAIVDSFKEPLYPVGRAFCLPNDDILIAYPASKENEVKALLIKAWMWFSGDPRTASDATSLQRYFYLPADKTSLMEEIRFCDKENSKEQRQQKEALEKKKFTLPPVIERNQKLLTPEILAKITKILAKTDFSSMIRRQTVCAILDDAKPQKMFDEVFVSISDLGETVLPDVSLTATPWLFQDLTETLDKRVLAIIERHEDSTLTHDFSLNLNVSTILSESFRDFDYNIRSGVKSSIVLELQPIDIFSDLQSYLLARNYAQNIGYKVCIDSVTEKSLRFIDREKLGADFIKLIWTNGLSEALEEDDFLKERTLNIGTNRAILCRVDDDTALEIGKKYNISLFQGRYVQDLLTTDFRRRRVGTTLIK